MTTTPKTLRLERTFDASPIEMWDAWTDPAQYARWFNPAPGIDLVIHEYDVRVGGKIRFDMPQPDGDPHPQEGVFHVVNPHTEIVTGSPDKSFLVKVNLVPVGKKTHLVVEVTGVPPEFHEMATQGWGAIFDKLNLKLARETPVGGQTLQIERTFDASPEEVFAAFTEAEQYAKWISPFPGLDAEIHEFEARPGGYARFTMIGPNDTRYPEAKLLFEVVRAPHEIVLFEANLDRPDVFDGHPMRMIMQFEPVGDKTRVTMTQHGLPTDVPAQMAKGGFNACFDKLEALLATRKKSVA